MPQLLLRGGWVCTEQDGRQVLLKDAYVGVENDKIAYVGKEKPAGYEQAEVLNRPYGLIIPGFIDLHYHSDSPVTKGFCEDCGSEALYGSILYEYLTAVYAAVTRDEWRAVANLTFAEMISGGITTCVEFNAYYPEDIAVLLGECGLRGYVAPETNSLDGYPHSPDGRTVVIEHKTGADMYKKLERNAELIERYNGAYDDRVRITLGPTEPPACRPELLREVRALAARYKVPITMHAAETMIERLYIREEYGMDSIEFLSENGIVGPDVILAHTVFANEREKRIMAETHTNVAHCPAIFVARGNYMRSLQSYTDLGINVSIGTDTFPQDMIREMRAAALMSKVADSDFRSGSSGLVFKCANQNGAKALGRTDIGRLTAGAKADIAVVSMDDFNTIPARDPIRVLISCGVARNVTDTIVDGRVLMRNRELVSLSAERVSREAWAAARIVWDRIPNLNTLSPLSIPMA
ncbi:MAG: amidohydrolase family protein [Clostridiales Family XIII bacterium]|jgi:cytosine/adenosine deaminase-related metal-dependent hydrolase|nr:amidohydrolase family protein [Clostridiales Family XIII bacterium]